MNRISAFVAHSFVPEDAELVGEFLKYFDQLSALHPAFTWESAEAAEPRALADKVKAIVADKNVLIAICTKRECVVAPGRLSKVLFQPKYLKALESHLEWKASDWIIQEIGLAIGKGLQLVLLVEEGLRQPGGLQGDMEYIPFERATPHRSFGRIVEMLKALSPKTLTADGVTSEPPRPQEVAPTDEQPGDDDNWQTPKPSWKRDEYESALLRCVVVGDEHRAQEIGAAYLSTESGAQPINAASWDAYHEYLRIHFARGGQLTKLKRLGDDNPDNSEVLVYLARGYLKYDQHEHAAEYFERASSVESEVLVRLYLLRRAAIARHRAGQVDAARALVDRMKHLGEPTESGEVAILKAEREVAKNDEVLVSAMERLADMDPSDTDLRFQLAYKHSELNNDDLALFHYSSIPDNERSAMAWNNLGVAYQTLQLPAKAISAFRKSQEMGETLGMSNIANRFIGAGFLEEAQTICQAALSAADYHKNVLKSVERIKEIPEEETASESELLGRARQSSDLYKILGHSLSKPMPTDLPSSWKGPDCVLQVTLSGTKLTAVGSYERSDSPFLRGLLGSTKLDTAVQKFKVEYEGAVRGGMVVGTVTRRREGDYVKLPTILGTEDDSSQVLMAVSDDATEIRVLERTKKGPPRTYALTRA